MKKTVYNTKLTARRASNGVAGGLVQGLAAMLTLSTPKKTSMRRHVESSNKALRGDFVRIGMDMRKAAAEVIAREETAS